LTHYDLSSLRYATTAGEALNPEVYNKFKEATGLSLMEGFGQTEATLMIANLLNFKPKPGSMGIPNPQYKMRLVDDDDNDVADGEEGEICIDISEQKPVGLFSCYYRDEDRTNEVMHDGLYHTGDTAWRDEDGYLWFVGRKDDLIKSSGYRIGPFEIESVLMEHPKILECAVTGVPDEERGHIVKATIVLVNGEQGTEQLKTEIQEFVKRQTAPYKYPRIIEFVSELPKTISGKIKRAEIRKKG
jgi:acetyl-CoA synthetase